MLALTLKTIRANKVRFLLTAVAVVLGVAFMAGTFVLTDTIKQSYDRVSTNTYKSTDAVVRSASLTKGDNGLQTRGTVSASVLASVRSVPGVRVAEAQQLGSAVIVGHNGALLDANRNRSMPVALAWQDSPALNPMELVAGHAPRAPDEIVIDRTSATKGHFLVGERVRVVSRLGSQPFRVAGVATYGGADDAAGAQVVAFTPATATKTIGTPGRYTAVEVVADQGVSSSHVVANLRRALHDPNLEVITGAQAASEARSANGLSLQFVNMFLMTFALVALVVGSFVIYNTFSITVAQRSRETAVMRAVGASRRQVMRSVRFEALCIGLVASVLGILAGIGTARGLRAALEAFGMELPAGNTVVTPRTVAVSMIVGVTVTLVAAWLPARRASKVAPIEALRDVALASTAQSRRRLVIGAVITGLGGLFLVRGLAGAGVGAVGLGALAVFVGVALLGPVIARRFAAIVGAPLPRVRGVAGTLARENAMRNPRRTAATASALMIGVSLVAFITVFAASAKASMATSIDTAMRSPWIVTTQYGMGGLSPAVTERIDALPETGAVTSLRFAQPLVGGSPVNAVAFDPAKVEENVDLQMQSGDVKRLGAHDVAVQVDEAKKRQLTIGSTVTLYFAETGAQRMHVVALYKTNQPVGEYAMATRTLAANVAGQVDDVVLVSNAPGYSNAQVRSAIERAIADTPTAELMTKSEFEGSVAHQIDRILNLVYVLLAMALVIALFGIANTLALSVFERTREVGLLRAVGAQRAQIRSTVRWESVLIGLLGTALGSVIGLGFAWAVVQAAHGVGIHELSIPAGQLAVIVIGTAVAAIAAASLPARRAARLDVLAAIGHE